MGSVKRCSKCGGKGPFYKNASTPDGLSVWCRSCILARHRAYGRTPAGLASRAWINITQRAGNRGGRYPTYASVELRVTRGEFVEWAMAEFSRWLCERPGVAPSVDRIRDDGHYELENLQIISRGDNARKMRQHKNVLAPPGKAWCGPCRKYRPVSEFSRHRRSFNGLQQKCKDCEQRTYLERRENARHTLV